MVEDVDLLPLPPIADVHVLHGGLNLAVAQVALRRDHIAPQFNEVGGKAVAGGVSAGPDGPLQVFDNFAERPVDVLFTICLEELTRVDGNKPEGNRGSGMDTVRDTLFQVLWAMKTSAPSIMCCISTRWISGMRRPVGEAAK